MNDTLQRAVRRNRVTTMQEFIIWPNPIGNGFCAVSRYPLTYITARGKTMKHAERNIKRKLRARK